MALLVETVTMSKQTINKDVHFFFSCSTPHYFWLYFYTFSNFKFVKFELSQDTYRLSIQMSKTCLNVPRKPVTDELGNVSIHVQHRG